MERYDRQIRLHEIGKTGQQLLSDAKVLVIGAGGLGCPALQYLAAAGVGTLGIMDFDQVERSNLQRQTLYSELDIGKEKALVAKKKLEALNSEIAVRAYVERLTLENARQRISNYDLVVDGTDNFEARYCINDVSILLGKPMIYGAIYKFEGQVSVFNYLDGPSYRCLFPEPPAVDIIPNCDTIGVLGVLPGIIGTMQAMEALKIILGIGEVLYGKILNYNSLTHHQSQLKLSRNTTLVEAVKTGTQQQSDFMPTCTPEFLITLEQAVQIPNVRFIDVRAIGERPKITWEKAVQIPLSELENKVNEFQKETPYVFFCQSGQRSRNAVGFINRKTKIECYSLKEGASELVTFVNKN